MLDPVAEARTEETPGHAFISYVREDTELVDRLQEILEAAGIAVWRDTQALWPGQDWKLEIRRAITTGSFVFIACFSNNSARRGTSYQNEELVLAVEQMRLRPPGTPWLVPIRFDDCALPEFDLGAGRTLDSLQRVDLFQESWDRGVARLVAAVLRIFGTPGADPLTNSRLLDRGDRVKRLLLDPNRQIELEDLAAQTAMEVREQIRDADKFSATAAIRLDIPGFRFLAARAALYAFLIGPAIEVLVPGCTWGLPEHEVVWTRVLRDIGNAENRTQGYRSLLRMGRFPALISLYAAGVASLHRGRYGNIRAISIDAIYRSLDGGPVPLIAALHPGLIFEGNDLTPNVLLLETEGTLTDSDIEQLITGRKGRRYTPVSEYLQGMLRPYFADLIVDDPEYLQVFDSLEVLYGVIMTDLRSQPTEGYVPSPWFGSFTWRERHSPRPVERQLLERLQAERDDAPEVRAGLFGGSSERAITAAEQFVEAAANVRQQRW